MSMDRSYDDGRPMPQLRAVPGGRRDREGTDEGVETVARDADPDSDRVRPAKVAEARLKILNDYYSRRDIQRELAERLVYELGA